MSNERSNHKPQSELVRGRNKRLKAERHKARMLSHAAKRPKVEDTLTGRVVVMETHVPRGTARNLRRKPLQAAYAWRLVNGAA